MSYSAMIAFCKEKKLKVHEIDGVSHLSSLKESSLGGVVAIQVVEHMEREVLENFLQLCASRIAPGGKLILETINPRSLVALSSNYFRDPTHVWPLHPDTLSYQATLAGFSVKEVTMRSPVPKHAQLPTIDSHPLFTPSEIVLVRSMNVCIERLNTLLYGYQDFAVIAERLDVHEKSSS